MFDSERLHTPSFMGLPTSIELFLSNKVKMKYVVYLFIAILVGAITGLLAKYSKSQKPIKISKTTMIDAPVSIVFQTLMDANLATEWVPNLISYNVISETPNMVGSIYRSQLNNNGLVYEQISEIKDLAKNQYIRWSGSCRFCESKVEYFLSPISDIRTEFKHVSECNYKGWTKVWVWLAKSKAMKTSDDFLNETHRNFKSLVEAKYRSVDG